MAKKRGSRRKGDRPTMASLADRHELYEASVQSVPDEVEFKLEIEVGSDGSEIEVELSW